MTTCEQTNPGKISSPETETGPQADPAVQPDLSGKCIRVEKIHLTPEQILDLTTSLERYPGNDDEKL